MMVVSGRPFSKHLGAKTGKASSMSSVCFGCRALAFVCPTIENQRNLNLTIAEAVTKTLEDRAEEMGVPTVDSIQRLLDARFEKQEMLHKEGIQKILEAQKNFGGGVENNDGNENEIFGVDDDGDGEGVAQTTFLVDGVFRFVPKTFQFPSCTVEEGLSFWFRGQSVSPDRRIRPHRKFDCRHALPTKELKKKFTTHWKALHWKIFEKELGDLPESASENDLKNYYEKCTRILCERAGYFCENGENMRCKISTWSRMVQFSSMQKYGTASDKEKLGVPSRHQKSRKRKFSRKGKLKRKPRFKNE